MKHVVEDLTAFTNPDGIVYRVCFRCQQWCSHVDVIGQECPGYLPGTAKVVERKMSPAELDFIDQIVRHVHGNCDCDSSPEVSLWRRFTRWRRQGREKA